MASGERVLAEILAEIREGYDRVNGPLKNPNITRMQKIAENSHTIPELIEEAKSEAELRASGIVDLFEDMRDREIVENAIVEIVRRHDLCGDVTTMVSIKFFTDVYPHSQASNEPNAVIEALIHETEGLCIMAGQRLWKVRSRGLVNAVTEALINPRTIPPLQ